MSQQSVLDVQDLYVTFHQDKKSAELVKGVSFSVAPGECLGILGESGSGKSMTAKAMLRSEERDFSIVRLKFAARCSFREKAFWRKMPMHCAVFAAHGSAWCCRIP